MLKGTVTEQSNSVLLENGREVRAVVNRNGNQQDAQRSIHVMGTGGTTFTVNEADTDNMIELLTWLKRA